MAKLTSLLAPLALASLGALVSTPLPWPLPSSPPVPIDPTVPYLPGVRTICPDGALQCYLDLETALETRTAALGCDHYAIFTDSYLTITRALIAAEGQPGGYYQRPDRVNHLARQYAQEAFDQYDRWRAGDVAHVAPAWRIAIEAGEHGTVSALGDALLTLNAHIRRDNGIRALEQAEGGLRVQGVMPEASGRRDQELIGDVLQAELAPMLDHLAAHYDPTIDDGADLFGMVLDEKGLYELISAWREEAWRNAEELRQARALGGVDGLLYQAKLAEIEASAAAGAEVILAATLTTPAQNAARDAYCAAHLHDPD